MTDFARLRDQTRAATAGIHLNNASAGLMPDIVPETMLGYLRDERDMGHHAAAEHHAGALSRAHADVARLLGTSRPVEFFDTVSRTMALLLSAVPWHPGDRLLIARHEWGAVCAAAEQLAARTGITIERIPCAPDTSVDTQALAGRLDERVRAICLPLHTAAGGRPTLDVDLERPEGCLLLGDAAQALGQLPFDLDRSGYDAVVGTGRKWLRGPRGIAFAGFSAAGRELMEAAPWLGDTPSGTAVTSDYTRVLRLGLGAAVAACLEVGVDTVHARVRALATRLHEGLSSLPGVSMLFPGPPASGIVTFTAGGREAAVVEALAREGVRIALLEARYHPGLFEDRGISRAVRISPHVFNTDQELDSALERIAAALGTVAGRGAGA